MAKCSLIDRNVTHAASALFFGAAAGAMWRRPILRGGPPQIHHMATFSLIRNLHARMAPHNSLYMLWTRPPFRLR